MQTCRTCKRMVLYVKIGGQLVATENALISVVPATVVVDGEGRHIHMAGESVQARQLHATLCPQYQEEDRKKRIAKEKREFEAQQQRAKGRNFGL